MFSTDKNIETIAQLIEVVRHYIGLQSKYMKLDVIDKIVRLFYLSFAAVYALEPFMGTAAAFACIAGVYFVVLLLFVVFRKKWIERPLVRFLASMLMQE